MSGAGLLQVLTLRGGGCGEASERLQKGRWAWGILLRLRLPQIPAAAGAVRSESKKRKVLGLSLACEIGDVGSALPSSSWAVGQEEKGSAPKNLHDFSGRVTRGD